LINRKIMS
jgi:hypothetical protein